ncbi:sulfurtransferase TusA family protein [Psychrobacter sp. CAL346-MNA-CIBAN-0220]|uniref:sulfurtransferase TusA family protein n=1 Tax=Psychrobacter sp. CAL346-MNA-CIBAN-0220 TaxID=3140457 RepID=UPI00332DE4C3
MSAANYSPLTMHAPYQIYLRQTLPESEHYTITSLLSLLPTDCIHGIQRHCDDMQNPSAIHIKDMVDGRGLACPMPLLKTKVALRNVAIGESLYVVATDPNSQADILAFCQQTQKIATTDNLLLMVNQTTNGSSIGSLSTQTFDTIFHFIITKTDSN